MVPESDNLAGRHGRMTRRTAAAGLALLALSGCSHVGSATDVALAPPPPVPPAPPVPAPAVVTEPAPPPPTQEQTASIKPDEPVDAELATAKQNYGTMTDGSFVLPAIPIQKLERKHWRKVVEDPTGEAPGTIVVHLQQRHLYLVQENGEALRYGVSIGKEGFAWSGRALVDHGRKWPTWTPPPEMVARKPELAKFSSGQPGGLDNPLGARALYIYQDGKDTLYRIHGTPEWKSIGKAASSGCVRMINQDVIDLYSRVIGKGKTPIVVVP